MLILRRTWRYVSPSLTAFFNFLYRTRHLRASIPPVGVYQVSLRIQYIPNTISDSNSRLIHFPIILLWFTIPPTRYRAKHRLLWRLVNIFPLSPIVTNFSTSADATYASSGCPGNCEAFVKYNPQAFTEAYFEFRSVRVYSSWAFHSSITTLRSGLVLGLLSLALLY
jgi:hypothetical protein